MVLISIGSNADRSEFADPLNRLQWNQAMGTDLVRTARRTRPRSHDCRRPEEADATPPLQAGGSASAIDWCRFASQAVSSGMWRSVRYIVGRPHNAPEALDVPITLPRSVETVSSSEVFGAGEAADVFFGYYRTGNIPPSYVLRPVEGYTADGHNIDLRSGTTE